MAKVATLVSPRNQIWGKDGKCHICIPKIRGCKYYDAKWAFTTFADLLLGFNNFATYLQGANL